MLTDIFVTKLGMTQAWTKSGKRLAVTRVKVGHNNVISKTEISVLDKNSTKRDTLPCTILEVGYGTKKLKNMTKPLRTRLEKSGFSNGVAKIRGVRMYEGAADVTIGDTITVDKVLEIGDVVKVQGITKGRGFAGGVKRWGFHGGPKTHGQSDRHRAVGSIGAGTTPGRVWSGKKMPGHYGNVAKTVTGLVVIHIDADSGEVWLSGPVPGSIMTDLKISKTGRNKAIEIDRVASSLPKVEVAEEVATENTESEA
ncbi:MAG: 50S ribosomal protein L3 [Candidatus Pacebacteria bacterium]|nr:50S ribosomal protein L3 [Candidatus Paceibacterota bacterium]NCS97010.1 50S ribosomal protein L3 [Candidatus Paceibacterota bacterium]PIZ79654.1 MAG: 50S ribosomal protein L3 [Candidatus Pacebacteria bacterium CG_4_10_14_0_2_um_filter_40_20]PJA69108.1 MAG: 50S ribosomal protein L3 [Candidatus Pacebacteria bacterium CG_4_9_14_3_um_filter_40_12]PJC41759.1 MAG: 50S ribosomal protein L3 [Candidatus Pacebacteria bacterium CG_4_9_14_0_2_um_filter_40_15]